LLILRFCRWTLVVGLLVDCLISSFLVSLCLLFFDKRVWIGIFLISGELLLLLPITVLFLLIGLKRCKIGLSLGQARLFAVANTDPDANKRDGEAQEHGDSDKDDFGEDRDFLSLLLRNRLVVHLRDANSELVGVRGVIGDVEVLHEDLAEDEVIKFFVTLRHDAQMAESFFGKQVLVFEQEALGRHFIGNGFANDIVIWEREHEIRHVLLNLFARMVKDAPVLFCAVDGVFRVLDFQVSLKLLKFVERHTDERIAGVDQCMRVVPEPFRVEACVVEFDLPAHRARCVKPDLLVPFLEELFVIPTESDL